MRALVDTPKVNGRRSLGQFLEGLAVLVILLFAADLSGSATVVVPALAVVAIVRAINRARTSVLDRASWSLGVLALMCGFLGYGLMAAGLALEHPLVVALFVATYPLVVAMQVANLRVRTLNSQLANFLDGGIVAALATAAMVQWIVPAQIRSGHTGWTLFVNLLFPALGVLSASATFILGSVVNWRFPPIFRLLVSAQICFLLADLLPLFEDSIGITAGLGVRAGAAAYLFIIVATRTNDRWTASHSGTSTPRVYLVVWVAVLLSLGALVAPNSLLPTRLFAALAICLVGIRLSLAFGEATTANELREEARTDELTGLNNRRALRELLDRLVVGRAPFSVLILDLDDFKTINDTLGHDAGDRMLKTVAARLLRVARQNADRMALFRLGGDEFAIVVLQPDEAARIAEAVVSIIRVPMVIDDERIDQSVSVGIANYPSDAEFPGDVLRLADAAMYRAKHLRTGFEVHDESLTEEISQLRILSVLRTALDAGSFELHYQPQVSLHSGQMIGLEALFRLPHKGSYLPAGGVIAAAEHAGILAEVTDAVIDRALAQLSTLLTSRPEIVLSLNVSGHDFESGTLAERLFRFAATHKVRHAQICIEVTEESLLHDPEAASATVLQLREGGFSVSMDDFGVGFSSLTNLRLLEVDELKIDRSFVSGLAHDERTEALLLSIVDMARRLKAKVLIEGVEHANEVERARSMGIDIAQGYVFAKPMPFAAVETWIETSADARARLVPQPTTIGSLSALRP